MAKQIIEDLLWKDRISTADYYYKQWSNLFKCDVLEQYYEGQQWKSQRELGYAPYVLNRFYENIQIKISQFVPTFPKFVITSKPQNSWDTESALRSSQVKQDVLNTLIENVDGQYQEELEMAYKDSYFRFGIMEVGYAADWIMNPNAPKPFTEGNAIKNANRSKSSRILEEPRELPVNERIYFKHVPARRFRVFGLDNKYLSRCSAVGYYDFVERDDLLSLKIQNRNLVERATTINPDYNPISHRDDNQRLYSNALKLWRIWDMRAMVQLLILDDPCVTVYQRKFTRLPLMDHRPDRRLVEPDTFYPIPVAFNWVSPQDEINEVREDLRTHRRRFKRKFQVMIGGVDDEELSKFETGPDGALIIVKRENAISPILNADAGRALDETLQTSDSDFKAISGVSDEDRGIADRQTATQANLINAKGQIRANAHRDRVVKWMIKMGREALLVCRERFTEGIWTKFSEPEGENYLGTVNPNKDTFKWISTENLKDEYDFKIDIDVTSISVASQEEEKNKLLEFLAALTQYPMVAFSPILVRELAQRIGYRNEKAIAEFQKQSLLMELGRMNQLQQQAGLGQQPQQQLPQPGNAAQTQVAQMTPPNMEQIRQQMTNQLGPKPN